MAVLALGLLVVLTVRCKGGGGLAPPSFDAAGLWDVELYDAANTSWTFGEMDFAKSGGNTYETPWDDTYSEFSATLTVTATAFTLTWEYEFFAPQWNSTYRTRTVISGTMTADAMTGAGTTTHELLDGADPQSYADEVASFTFTATRL